MRRKNVGDTERRCPCVYKIPLLEPFSWRRYHFSQIAEFQMTISPPTQHLRTVFGTVKDTGNIFHSTKNRAICEKRYLPEFISLRTDLADLRNEFHSLSTEPDMQKMVAEAEFEKMLIFFKVFFLENCKKSFWIFKTMWWLFQLCRI